MEQRQTLAATNERRARCVYGSGFSALPLLLSGDVCDIWSFCKSIITKYRSNTPSSCWLTQI